MVSPPARFGVPHFSVLRHEFPSSLRKFPPPPQSKAESLMKANDSTICMGSSGV